MKLSNRLVPSNRLVAFLVLAALAAATAVAACTSSDAPHETLVTDSGTPDTGVVTDSGSGSPDGGADGPAPLDCFLNPQTHYEIINACTDAQKVDKTPTLPLLAPDGSLPPLP